MKLKPPSRRVHLRELHHPTTISEVNILKRVSSVNRQYGLSSSTLSRAHRVHSCIFQPLQYSTTNPHLNSVTNLRPLDTAESPYEYSFKVQCTSCRETHPNWVSLNRFEQHEQQGSRGEANFVWRCQNCKVPMSPAPSTHHFFSSSLYVNVSGGDEKLTSNVNDRDNTQPTW